MKLQDQGHVTIQSCTATSRTRSLRIKEKLGLKYAIQEVGLWKILSNFKHVKLKRKSKIQYSHVKNILDNAIYIIINAP